MCKNAGEDTIMQQDFYLFENTFFGWERYNYISK